MAQLELLKLPSDLIRSALLETVAERLESKEFSINVSSTAESGENNFMGVVYRASFNKRNRYGESGKDQIHKVIIKAAPQNNVRRAKCFARPSFLREIHMYDKVTLVELIGHI